MFAVESGGLRSLGDRFSGVLTLAVSDNGRRAVLTWPDRRELVALPSGNRLAVLDRTPTADGSFDAVTLDSEGRRVAYFSASVLRIMDVSDPTRPVLLHSEPALRSGALRFSPDGRSLAVMSDEAVHVLREGQAPSMRRLPRYDVELPKGFIRDDQREAGERRDGFLARYWRDEPAAEVVVTVTDSYEFGEPDAPVEEWAAPCPRARRRVE